MSATRPMHVRFREAMERAALAADWRRKRKPGNPYDHLMSMTKQGQSLSVMLYELEREGAAPDLLNGLRLPLERLCHAIAHLGPEERLRWLDIVRAYARAIDTDAQRRAAIVERAQPLPHRKDIFG